MEFRIADTFTDSLAKLTGDEQKAVKTTAFDLQMNPASPGMQFHRLDKAKDKRFWSVRAGSDIRLIVHKTDASLLLCYVDHHDDAYDWAERRKIETHPKTGAAQLVEIRETVKEIAIPKYVEVEQPVPSKPLLFAGVPEEILLSYGVPIEWLDDVHNATEESLFELSDHLPREAAEALLELATGGKPQVPQVAAAETNPFEHPDALRRFRVMTNVEELRRALEYPWEKWTVFLHPDQQGLVERNFNGPARISGSAGTGKTIVALHRAVYLLRQHPVTKVLLATFSETLASSLRTKLSRLIGDEHGLQDRIQVDSVTGIATQLYTEAYGPPDMASEETLRELLKYASAEVDEHRFSERFIFTEWTDVADAWQLTSWESYRDVARLGRKTRIGEKQRELLWSIFDKVRQQLEHQDLLTMPTIFHRVADSLKGKTSPFEFAVIDEAQDISVPELRFLAALGGDRPNALFFAGDLGQRIFQTPFSWKSLGVDVRGRSHTLRINYRTSHQIRTQVDSLLPPELSDVDGNAESRRGTISVFNGPVPSIKVFDSQEDESAAVAEWIVTRIGEDNVRPHEIGVFVRSDEQLARAGQALHIAGIQSVTLDDQVETTHDHISLCTMHLAKGLEFRAVVVMACDDDVIPLQERIESVVDDSDLEEVYNTERHLLYVACTRARDHMFVTGVEPASEFLDDLRGT